MTEMFNDNFFLKVGVGLLSWFAFWFIKTIWDRNSEVREQVKAVNKELTDFKQEIRKEYQSKELAAQINQNMRQQLDQILKKLDTIDNKLDKKADK